MSRNVCAMVLLSGTVLGLESVAVGQDDPTVTSARRLLERLQAAGVEIPEGMVINDDGTVTLPAAMMPEPAEMVEQAEGAC